MTVEYLKSVNVVGSCNRSLKNSIWGFKTLKQSRKKKKKKPKKKNQKKKKKSLIQILKTGKKNQTHHATAVHLLQYIIYIYVCLIIHENELILCNWYRSKQLS